MKISSRFRWLAAASLYAMGVVAPTTSVQAQTAYTPPTSSHVDLNFNYDWKFIRQDVSGASATSFDDSAWQPVSLPHTWNDDRYRLWTSYKNDTDKSDPANPVVSGGAMAQHGYTGIGWYRKYFTLDSSYGGRKVILEFQGICRAAHFFVNGTDLGYHENGIGPCGLDITSALKAAGTQNVIAIQVSNDPNYVQKGAQFAGTQLNYNEPFNLQFGGLQRDVTMHVTDPLFETQPLYRNLGTQGTYVYATNIDTLRQTATIGAQVEVKNDSGAAQNVSMDAVIVDKDGNQVGSTFSASAVSVPATSTGFPGDGSTLKTLTATTNMTGIHFWSPDYPYLYQVYTIIKVNGAVKDVAKTVLGVRHFLYGADTGFRINGQQLYLKGYAPRSPMEWASLGIPPDWMVDYDFDLIKQTNGNFLRPMHSAPRKVLVDAADKYGVIMTVPAVSTENDPAPGADGYDFWPQRLADMQDLMIYYRNNPSVAFFECTNGDSNSDHMQAVVDLRKQWDPYGGRYAGTRSTGSGSDSYGIAEYGCPMDGTATDPTYPYWDAEYGRGEAPRRVWDNYSPMFNPRWDGSNTSGTPAAGTVGDTTHKYLLGGYFYIASSYFQSIGLNQFSNGDAMGDYLAGAYFRLNNSEDMVLENLAKYWARYKLSAFVQAAGVSHTNGSMVGGAKIIWADSPTDGRMYDTEMTRVSGVLDASRLPKELFYAMQIAQAPNEGSTAPQYGIHIVGHWNYPTGTKKNVYVVSNTKYVTLQQYDSGGNKVGSPVSGSTNFPLNAGGDQINHYVFQFPNIAWQAGSLVATGTNDGSSATFTDSVATVGAPYQIMLTPSTGPAGWQADGEDIAMYDVQVVDSKGNVCPTYEDAITFSCSGPGVFLGGYNSGLKRTTNFAAYPTARPTSGYKLNVEAGVNRVFVRSTRTAGTFTLSATGAGLVSASNVPVASSAFTVTNGIVAAAPARYAVDVNDNDYYSEPAPVAEDHVPPPVQGAPNAADPGDIVGLGYSGAHQDAAIVIHNVQAGQQAYQDNTSMKLPSSLPNYLLGGDFVQAFQGDAGVSAATDQYQMHASRYSYVYQVIDHANGMPNHDNNGSYGWSSSPVGTLTLAGSSRPMDIYKSKLLPPGTLIYLADNGYQNAGGKFDAASNMYMVFVVSAEQELQQPGDAITASTTQGSNAAANAIDANFGTRWNANAGASSTNPGVLTLTLANPSSVGSYEITWASQTDAHYYQYVVDVSSDNTNWSPSLDASNNVTPGTSEFRVPASLIGNSQNIKYVRLTVKATSGGAWPAVSEFKVHGVLNSAGSSAAVPTINSTTSPTGARAGFPFTYTVTNSGNTATGYAAQNLPPGLNLNGDVASTDSTAGQITGTLAPNVDTSKTWGMTVSGINAGGTGSQLVSFTIAPPPPPPVVNSATSYPSGSVTVPAGVAITSTNTYQTTATNMTDSTTGGKAFSPTPATFNSSITTTTHPGFSFSSSTGKITGTPKYPGTYTIYLWGQNPGSYGTVSKTDGTATGNYSVATLTYTVAKNGTAPTIANNTPPDGTEDVAYAGYTPSTTGSPTRFRLDSQSGPLPPGLKMDSTTGAISGTPTQAATYPIIIDADNAGGTAQLSTSIRIVVNPNVPVITNTSSTISGNAQTAISPYQITSNPSAQSYGSSGAFPAGISLNASTGVISGTPTATAANTTVTVTATNTVNGTAYTSDPFTLTFNIQAHVPAPVMATSTPLNLVGEIGHPFSYQFSASNTPKSFTVSGLPPGVTLTDAVNGIISGKPTSNASSPYSVSVSASNDGGTSSTKTVTFTVAASGTDINLALNQPAAASTVNTKAPSNVAANAFDGQTTSTRWESNQGTKTTEPEPSGTSWLYVDLGAARSIHSVTIYWQNAAAKVYDVQWTNGDPTVDSNWTNAAAEITNGASGETRAITLNSGLSARYVRVLCKQRTTIYGYSIFDLQVMGTAP